VSGNLSSSQSMGPLSVGNVVSAALRIYRDRFKLYYRLAFIAYLWILVPVYGWAKFTAISALISRLVFGEITNRPEPVNEARRPVERKLWSFLGAGLLVGLIFIGVGFGFSIVFGILAGVLGTILGQNPTVLPVLGLLGVVAFIAFVIGFIRLISRLFLVDVPLAIENDLGATSAISRSWQLTKGYVSRLQWIVFVAFLLTLPISIAVQIVLAIVQVVLGAVLPTESGIFAFLYFVLVLGLSFASGALLIPFWQAIKAIVYYDLRNRKEGMDLKLRNSR
jgi:F0F1-type ATP synthase membrane subunit c/vacuolar-type H+-ATPase subunit K